MNSGLACLGPVVASGMLRKGGVNDQPILLSRISRRQTAPKWALLRANVKYLVATEYYVRSQWARYGQDLPPVTGIARSAGSTDFALAGSDYADHSARRGNS